ncbi:uncharacterized protein LOC109907114 isoform X1 [Oncorhynchus kisutch]|uniref:uncharacterized protein LOC109907114 isoform X1 n=1 Tax=Oncorhynchus kisutch TaxID=8019 RepID=UPI0009A0996F|nr:uncharacterized protein LOC109907114 isoform X1 [Oncorhynchus kisutch]XP_031658795.1 uncharacterized protein LOC109907114 isoform X1 [Oncorhynchus kisutch]
MVTAGVFLGPVASCFGTSFHNTMSPLMWIVMMLILSQASGTSGVVWKADYPKVVFTKLGEDVTIPCNVTYPPSQSKGPIQAYWKRWGNTQLNINDNDKNEFLYHPNNTFVIKSFQTRTNLTGNITKGNCSLKINIIQHGDIGHFYYLRIATGADNFSFKKELVSIQISGTSGTISTIPKDMSNTVDSTTTVPLTTTENTLPKATYIATTVSVVAVLLVAVLGIVWFFKYRKRARGVTKQESGYYANFTMTTPTTKPERVNTTKKDDTQVPPPKVIDEPVYGNVQGPDDPMDSMDQMDSVYANVDHAKQ